MAADSQYFNLVVPAGAGGADGSLSAPELAAGGAGSAPATGAQETASTALGAAVMGGAAGGAAPSAERMRQKHTRGNCRCWWVALAAVVVIALVARS